MWPQQSTCPVIPLDDKSRLYSIINNINNYKNKKLMFKSDITAGVAGMTANLCNQ